MEQQFSELLNRLFALQLYYKTVHWLVNCNSFKGDHDLANELYGDFEDLIDTVAEIGKAAIGKNDFLLANFIAENVKNYLPMDIKPEEEIMGEEETLTKGTIENPENDNEKEQTEIEQNPQEEESEEDFNTNLFSQGLQIEEELLTFIEDMQEGKTAGIINLLGDIAQKSYHRMYKIKQRIV